MAVKRKEYVYLVRWADGYFEEIKAYKTRTGAHRARPRMRWNVPPIYITLELKK